MSATERDVELCELYLDHELADAEARALDERLASDAELQATLERLRGQRAVRLEAMSTAFDTDAASIERLVAGVRTARAREVATRKAWWQPSRQVLAAAASVAVGLLVGAVVQGRQSGRWVATPTATTGTPSAMVRDGSTSVGFGTGANSADFSGHGQYVVSLVDQKTGKCVKVRFHSPEHARQFLEYINSGRADRSLTLADGQVLDETY